MWDLISEDRQYAHSGNKNNHLLRFDNFRWVRFFPARECTQEKWSRLASLLSSKHAKHLVGYGIYSLHSELLAIVRQADKNFSLPEMGELFRMIFIIAL